MSDFRERFKSTKRSTLMVAGATLSFLFLALLSALNMSVSTDKVFGVNNFYQGSKGSPIDPKAQYNEMYNNIQFNANKCSTQMKLSSNAKPVGSYYWFVEGQSVKDESELRAIAEDDEMTKLKPFSSDGQLIVAPGDIEFVNANTEQNSKDSIDISFNIGTKHVMEFRNVKSWWCHIGKEDPTMHTDRVGAGGIGASCAGGYIIGEAKADTTVYLYELDSNGAPQPASFSDLYVVQSSN